VILISSYIHKNVFSFLQISNVVGYAVGEYINEDEDENEDNKGNEFLYEIVTAWIHPRCRLNKNLEYMF